MAGPTGPQCVLLHGSRLGVAEPDHGAAGRLAVHAGEPLAEPESNLAQRRLWRSSVDGIGSSSPALGLKTRLASHRRTLLQSANFSNACLEGVSANSNI